MSSKPVVAVLHDASLPDSTLLEPVANQAELRLTSTAGLATAIRGADVLFLYDFFSTALEDVWHAADRLSWIHVAAAGVDSALSEEVRSSDVTVTNSRGIFDGSIAEYVLAQILSFAKDLPGSLQLQHAHQWRHRESERICDSRALIVGTGPIGRAIARLLRAAGIQVHAAGRRTRQDDPDFGEVTGMAGLHRALSRSEWVIAAAPLTSQTQGMFNADAFAAMSSHARFINVGRGELVCTDALVHAVRSGEIAGAALDVVDPEPLPTDHPLWELPDVILTPHNSGDFIGWREALVTLFVENFERWHTGAELRNVVDKTLGYVPTSGS